MNRTDLSLDQAPPLAVPLRFFLTAPLFGVAAALLLLGYGPDLLISRWSPPLLAATHLLTLGVITMVMLGAWLQLLPVLIGAPVRRPRLVSGTLHALLTAAVPLLVTGFATGHTAFTVTGGALLGLTFAAFIGIAFAALHRARSGVSAARVMRRALLALTVAAAIGLYRAGSMVWGYGPATPELTDIHLGWALIGWVGLTVLGVAYHVLPMFQTTPEYPAWLRLRLHDFLLVMLLIWSVVRLTGAAESPLATLAGIATLSGCALFAAVTLRLHARRRRSLPDTTLHYWTLGMAGVLAACLLWGVAQFVPALAAWNAYPLLLGVLVLAGAVLPVINGMLYKIVPFLCWLHLHRQLRDRAARRARLPAMQEFIPERRAQRQFLWYLAALALLLAAVVLPQWFVYPAGAAFGVTCGMLGTNLARAVWHYRRLLGG